jgi:hypothetical protein
MVIKRRISENKAEKETWKYARALVALGPGSSQKTT